MDICAAIACDHTILPGKRAAIETGLCVSIPSGFEIQIRSRSGLSWNHGVIALNAPGTIDSDYRGEIKIILANMGDVPFVITPGMRIAQMVLARYNTIVWDAVEDLDSTKRHEGGFGSTGL